METIELLGIEQPQFSQQQIGTILEEAKNLQEYVKRHGVHFEATEADQVEETAESSPNRVFSLVGDPELREGYQARYFLFQGFIDDLDDYFLGSVDLQADLPYPCTILDFDCVECHGSGEDGDEECTNCDDGELSVDLFWDQNWRVTVEYSGS